MSIANKAAFSQNSTTQWIHIIICVLLMFGFKFIPPVEPLTKVGMGVVGVFLGLIYGWGFIDMLWVSLLGIVAISFTDYCNLSTAFANSFANNVFLTVLFIFTIIGAVQEAGVVNWIAEKIVSLKIGRGRPWILSFLLLFCAFFISSVINGYVAVVLTWALFARICEVYDMPKGKYTAYMIVGVVYANIVGSIVFPFSPPTMILVGAYTGASGYVMNWAAYSSLKFFILSPLSIIVYLLVGRMFLKLNVDPFLDKSKKIDDPGKLNFYQKFMLCYMIILMIALFWPSVAPKSWAITQVLSALGMNGTTAIFLVFLAAVNFSQGVSIKKLIAEYVLWDVLFVIGAVMVISSALSAEQTGISAFLTKVLDPIFGGKGTLVFLILVTIIPAILTNVFNNTATALIFIPIIYTFSEAMGINHAAVCIILVTIVSMALATPAGSAPAAMLFGNKDWVTPKECTIYGIIACVCCYLVNMLVGLPLAFVIF